MKSERHPDCFVGIRQGKCTDQIYPGVCKRLNLRPVVGLSSFGCSILMEGRISFAGSPRPNGHRIVECALTANLQLYIDPDGD